MPNMCWGQIVDAETSLCSKKSCKVSTPPPHWVVSERGHINLL